MKAVIYARYSSDNQREESIEGQIRECTEYAVRNDITILSSYIDRALSARTADRPEFQRMIADSEKGLFDVVLVWKLDRFSRDRYDSAHYKHILKKNGVRVISARENISEGPEGIILESMLEGYAEYYSAGRRKMRLNAAVMAAIFHSAIRLAQTAYWKLTLPLPHWLRKSLPVMRAAKPSRLSPIRSMSADFAHEKTGHSVWHRSASPLKTESTSVNINTPTPLFQTEFLPSSLSIYSSGFSNEWQATKEHRPERRPIRNTYSPPSSSVETAAG